MSSKSIQGESSSIQTDGRTNMKLIVAFRNFANAPKICSPVRKKGLNKCKETSQWALNWKWDSANWGVTAKRCRRDVKQGLREISNAFCFFHSGCSGNTAMTRPYGTREWLFPSPRSPGFGLQRSSFEKDKVAMRRGFLRIRRFFFPVSIIPPASSHTHLFTYHRLCIILAIDSVVK